MKCGVGLKVVAGAGAVEWNDNLLAGWEICKLGDNVDAGNLRWG